MMLVKWHSTWNCSPKFVGSEIVDDIADVPQDKYKFCGLPLSWSYYHASVEETIVSPSEAQKNATKCRREARRLELLYEEYATAEHDRDNYRKFGLTTISGPFPSHADSPAWECPGYKLGEGLALKIPGMPTENIGAILHAGKEAMTPPSQEIWVYRLFAGTDDGAVKVRPGTQDEIARAYAAVRLYAAHREAATKKLSTMDLGCNWMFDPAKQYVDGWCAWLEVTKTGKPWVLDYRAREAAIVETITGP